MTPSARALAVRRKKAESPASETNKARHDVIIFQKGTEVKAGKYFTAREWAFFAET